MSSAKLNLVTFDFHALCGFMERCWCRLIEHGVWTRALNTTGEQPFLQGSTQHRNALMHWRLARDGINSNKRKGRGQNNGSAPRTTDNDQPPISNIEDKFRANHCCGNPRWPGFNISGQPMPVEVPESLVISHMFNFPVKKGESHYMHAMVSGHAFMPYNVTVHWLPHCAVPIVSDSINDKQALGHQLGLRVGEHEQIVHAYQ
ncbi:hypothetical protein DFH07DRAFT_773217 [Mycena maculata]|uniref:Uncharacterized protein n=1 Tax=Mycena maculata TaxID=230809 RepID=A0AAD7J3C2_9AGAR|nr:hypothetical protein DFH07DRAFT_773217 [Mycena maculata]